MPRSEVGDWVHPLDGDLEGRGWAIALGYSDEVDIEVQSFDSPPALHSSAAAVVEVSCEGEMAFVNDEGERVEVPRSTERVHRVRLSLHTTQEAAPKLVTQSWPAPAAPPAVLRSSEGDAKGSRLRLPEAAEGLAAAGRIGDDVDRGTVYTVEDLTGVAVAEVVVEGQAKYLSGYFEKARSWTTDDNDYLWLTSWEWEFNGPTAFMRHEDHPDRLSGRTGAIWSTPHPDYSEPHAMVLWWNWLIPPRDSPRRAFVDFVKAERPKKGRPDRLAPIKLLPRDTIRKVTLEQLSGTPQMVRVRVEHSGLPHAWADDVAKWSRYQLAIWGTKPRPIR